MKVTDNISEDLQEHWDVIKVHEICHFPRNIERSGTTQHYNAELYENLHQKVKFSLLSVTSLQYPLFRLSKNLRG